MALQQRAPVFQHFHDPDSEQTNSDDQVRLLCRYCDKFVAGSYRITSNFHSHMRRWHPEIWIEYAKPVGGQLPTNFNRTPPSTQSYWEKNDVGSYDLTGLQMMDSLASTNTEDQQVILQSANIPEPQGIVGSTNTSDQHVIMESANISHQQIIMGSTNTSDQQGIVGFVNNENRQVRVGSANISDRQGIIGSVNNANRQVRVGSANISDRQVLNVESDDSDEVIALDDTSQTSSLDSQKEQNDLTSQQEPLTYNTFNFDQMGGGTSGRRTSIRRVPIIFQHFARCDEPPTAAGSFKMMCIYCSKKICGSNRITSNFHTHMRRCHPDIPIDSDYPNTSSKFLVANSAKPLYPAASSSGDIVRLDESPSPLATSQGTTLSHCDGMRSTDDVEILQDSESDMPSQIFISQTPPIQSKPIFPIKVQRTSMFSTKLTDCKQFEQSSISISQNNYMDADKKHTEASSLSMLPSNYMDAEKKQIEGRGSSLSILPSNYIDADKKQIEGQGSSLLFLPSRTPLTGRRPPVIFQHFELVDEPPSERGTIKMMCKYCAKHICGSSKITSNFHAHMRRWHQNIPIDPSQPDIYPISFPSQRPSVSSAEESNGKSPQPALAKFSGMPPLGPIRGPQSPTVAHTPSPSLKGNNQQLFIQSSVFQNNNLPSSSIVPQGRSMAVNILAPQASHTVTTQSQIQSSCPATPTSNNTNPGQLDSEPHDTENQSISPGDESQTSETDESSQTSTFASTEEKIGNQLDRVIKMEDNDERQANKDASQIQWTVDSGGKATDVSGFLAIQTRPPIFQHFHIPAELAASTGQLKLVCKYCGKLVSGSFRATSNFHTHVKRWHPDVEIEAGQPGPTQVRVPTIPSFWKETDRRHTELTDLLVKFISNSLQPLSIVDDPYFCTLLLKAQPAYSIPNSSKLRSTIIPAEIEDLQDRIHCSLEKAAAVSVTVDVWISMNKCYIGVTGHVIEDFELENFMLGCQSIQESSDECVLKHYREIVQSLNCEDKVATVVVHNFASILTKNVQFPGYESVLDADQDSNIADSRKDEKEIYADDEVFDKLPSYTSSFFHTLQLVVKDGLNKIGEESSIITKASKLFRHICKSGKAPDIFGIDFEMLADNDALWVNAIKILRLVISANVVKIEDYDGMLTKQEISILSEIIDILTPFEVVVDKCQGDKIVTASLVIPCIRGLCSVLHEMSVVHMTGLLDTLKLSIEMRLSKYESMDVFQLAAAMDPRFKLDWCNADEVQAVKDLMVSKLSVIETKGTTSSPSSPEPPKKKSKLFQFMTPTRNPEVVASSSSQIQVDKYLMEVSIPEDDDPLVYWRWKRSDLPELAQVAVNVLATPAISTPVEKLFVGTARTVRPNQGCLSDKEFEELMFLRGNSHLDLKLT